MKTPQMPPQVAPPVMRPVVVQQPMGHTAYHHLGELDAVWAVAKPAAVGLAIYHAHKRYHKATWVAGFALAALISPILTSIYILATGVGKKGSR